MKLVYKCLKCYSKLINCIRNEKNLQPKRGLNSGPLDPQMGALLTELFRRQISTKFTSLFEANRYFYSNILNLNFKLDFL